MRWTVKDVERWMVTAERADPRVRNPGEARPAGWIMLHVRDSDQRAALKLWVWCQANGYAFHDVCRRRGPAYSTALRRKNAAVAAIVSGLNAEAEPHAAASQQCAFTDCILPLDSG